MNQAQALSLLALRRLRCRLGAPDEPWPPAGHEPGGNGSSALLVAPDRQTLARALPRAADRVWLSLEVLLSRDALAPQLDGPAREELAAVLEHPGIAQLCATPLPFREPLRRDLHAARTAGPLAPGPVDPEDLLRQLTLFGRPADPRTAHDLEWYALWQMADELARQGFPGLRALFEARSAEGASLLVGRFAAFAAHELEAEGEAAAGDAPPGPVPPELAGWVARHAERLGALLGGPPAAAPPAERRPTGEAATRVRQGLAH